MEAFSIVEYLYVIENILLYCFYCSIFFSGNNSFFMLAKKLSIQLLSYGQPGLLMLPVMWYSLKML